MSRSPLSARDPTLKDMVRNRVFLYVFCFYDVCDFPIYKGDSSLLMWRYGVEFRGATVVDLILVSIGFQPYTPSACKWTLFFFLSDDKISLQIDLLSERQFMDQSIVSIHLRRFRNNHSALLVFANIPYSVITLMLSLR